MLDRIPEWGALIMVTAALFVVSFLALKGNEAAVGSMIGIVAAGVGYFLRGKVRVS